MGAVRQINSRERRERLKNDIIGKYTTPLGQKGSFVVKLRPTGRSGRFTLPKSYQPELGSNGYWSGAKEHISEARERIQIYDPGDSYQRLFEFWTFDGSGEMLGLIVYEDGSRHVTGSWDVELRFE